MMRQKDTQDETGDEATGQKERLRGHKLTLTCVCIDSKNKSAFTASKDGSIIKWSIETHKILNKVNPIKQSDAEDDESEASRRHVKHINCIAISSEDKFLATGGWDKSIRLWSPDTLEWIHTFSMHRKEVTALAFRHGYPTLYSGSVDRSVMIWNLEDDDNKCFVEALFGHESAVTSLDSLRRERVVSSGGQDQSIRLWKIVDQAQSAFHGRNESIDVVRYIDDKTFISAGESGGLTIWTTMKKTSVFHLKDAHGFESNDKKSELTRAGLTRFWISALATFLDKNTTASEPQSSLAATKKRKLDNDQSEVVSYDYVEGSDVGSDAESDVDEVETDKGTSGGSATAFIASGSCDGKLKIWRMTRSGGKYDLEMKQSFDCPGFINDLKFSNDGKKIVAACGQEHKFGRWWKLKGTKNCIRIFDLNLSSLR